jgi:hypothetical protein
MIEIGHRLASANPMSLTGNEAFKIFLELQKLDELQEKNERMTRLLKQIRDISDDVKREVGCL